MLYSKIFKQGYSLSSQSEVRYIYSIFGFKVQSLIHQSIPSPVPLECICTMICLFLFGLSKLRNLHVFSKKKNQEKASYQNWGHGSYQKKLLHNFSGSFERRVPSNKGVNQQRQKRECPHCPRRQEVFSEQERAEKFQNVSQQTSQYCICLTSLVCNLNLKNCLFLGFSI